MGTQGKFVRLNKNDPKAIAQSDFGGRVCMHEDLVWQWDYNGTGLYNRKLLVHKDQADKPNAQFMVPRMEIDPVPTKDARPIYYPFDNGYDDD